MRLRARRTVAMVAVLALSGGLAPVALASTAAASAPASSTTTFPFTGAQQTYVVPADVTSLRIMAVGAPGGDGGITACNTGTGTCPASPGGRGAALDAVFPVCDECAIRTGDTLYVTVGGKGGSGSHHDSNGPTPGGFNGGGSSLRGTGGGGGGASDVRTVPGSDPGSYDARIVVAGGGGGAGSNGNSGGSRPGGRGGSGGLSDGAEEAHGAVGTRESNGWADGGGGGRAATRSAGGAGGVVGAYAGHCNPGDAGRSGSLGQGGSGGWESNFSSGRAAATGGGGGGGGYYGGGGGAGGAVCGADRTAGAGGGGVGSSFVDDAAVPSTISTDTAGEPQVRLIAGSSTTTTLSCASAAVIGVATTCTATVTGDSAAQDSPTGTVTFSSTGAGAFGSPTCTLTDGSCSTTFTPTGDGGGSQTISAAYGGDTTHNPGPTATTSVAIDKRATAVSATCPPGTVGRPTTCVATVTDSDTGAQSVPRGVVTWSGGGFAGATCTLTAGRCSATVTPSSVQTAALSLAYAGDAAHGASTGGGSLTVAQGQGAIAIANLPADARVGGSFTPTFDQTGDGAPSVTSRTTATCTVTATGTVDYAGAGTCELQVSATATTDHTAATGVQSFTIARNAAAVSIDNLPVITPIHSSLTVTFDQVGDGTPEVVSLTSDTCLTHGATVWFYAAGSCELQAITPTTDRYEAATGPTQTVVVGDAPVVSQEPVDRTVVTRETATFVARATSALPATVQWQVSTDDGAHWNDLPSADDPTLAFTASIDQDGNHYRAIFTSAAGRTISAAATLTVTRIPLTVTASSGTMTYGGSAPSVGPRYAGLADGDTVDAVVLEQPRCSGGAGSSSPVGSYTTSCSGGSFVSDYAVTYRTGSVSVTPATLTVTAEQASRAYGAANPTFTYAVTGLVNGDSPTIVTGAPTLTTSAGRDSNAGRYPIVAGVGTIAAPNYTIATVDGVLDVVPAVLTVTASDESQVYGQAAPRVTPHYAGFVEGDGVASLASAATCVASTSTTTDTGTYATTCSGARDPDYDVRYVPGTVTVTPAPQTLVSTTVVPRHPATRTTLRLSATPGASGTPVAYAVSARSDAGACRLRGVRTVRLTGIGTCVIGLSQPASRNYQAATTRVRIEVDTSAPAWRSPRQLKRIRVGSRSVVGLALTGTPKAKVRLERGALPPGLALRAGSPRLAGRPQQAGRFTFVLSATNRAGSTERTFVVRVARARA